MSNISLNNSFIKSVVKLALKEDLYPSGDISSALIKNKKNISIKLISNQYAIIGGLNFAKQVFRLIDKKIKFKINKKEGSVVKKGNIIATINQHVQKYLDVNLY